MFEAPWYRSPVENLAFTMFVIEQEEKREREVNPEDDTSDWTESIL